MQQTAELMLETVAAVLTTNNSVNDPEQKEKDLENGNSSSQSNNNTNSNKQLLDDILEAGLLTVTISSQNNNNIQERRTEGMIVAPGQSKKGQPQSNLAAPAQASTLPPEQELAALLARLQALAAKLDVNVGCDPCYAPKAVGSALASLCTSSYNCFASLINCTWNMRMCLIPTIGAGGAITSIVQSVGITEQGDRHNNQAEKVCLQYNGTVISGNACGEEFADFILKCCLENLECEESVTDHMDKSCAAQSSGDMWTAAAIALSLATFAYVVYLCGLSCMNRRSSYSTDPCPIISPSSDMIDLSATDRKEIVEIFTRIADMASMQDPASQPLIALNLILNKRLGALPIADIARITPQFLKEVCQGLEKAVNMTSGVRGTITSQYNVQPQIQERKSLIADNNNRGAASYGSTMKPATSSIN